MLEISAIVATIMIWAVAYRRPGIGILLALPGCLILCLFGAAAELPLMVALGVSVLIGTLVVIAAAPRDPLASPRPRRWARLTLWGLLALVVSLAVLVVLGPLGIPVLLVLVLGVAGALVSGLEARRATVSVVLSTLNAAMRQNLPLPMALDSAGAGRDDMAGHAMRQISRWLVQGYPLSEAICLGFPRCPGRAYGMIVAAERMGQVPAALEVIERDRTAAVERRNLVNPVFPFYPLALIVVIALIVSFLMTFVIPQFSSVLGELTDGPLPVATELLIQVHRCVRDWIWTVVVAAVLICGVVLILRRWQSRRPGRPRPLSGVVDSVRWVLPISRSFERDRSMVQTADALRLALDAGHTVDQAIAATLSLDTNLWFRRRLRAWLSAVQQGQDAASAALKSRLAPALAWAFDTRVNQGNTPTVLEMIGSFYQSNYSYRVNLARLFLWPCVTVAMACVVGFVAYAVFSPLVAVLYASMDFVP
ncbi:MAG: type II secretion system F family protein [Phycisphaerae bacterium]|nr:type II secretion system F family protein [Phycisphaerae bacterium]